MSLNIAAHPVTHKYAWRHGQPAPGGSRVGSFRSTYSHRCAQTDPSPKALKRQESTKHREAPGAAPSHITCHHTTHTRACAATFLLPASLSLPCALSGPGSFFMSLGLLRPVPLPSELGWALLSAEISWRNRAIFCHRQEVRMRE